MEFFFSCFVSLLVLCHELSRGSSTSLVGVAYFQLSKGSYWPSFLKFHYFLDCSHDFFFSFIFLVFFFFS